MLNTPASCPHLEIEAFSINTKSLHQREGCGLQQVDLQEAKRLNPSKIAVFQGFKVKSISQKTARTKVYLLTSGPQSTIHWVKVAEVLPNGKINIKMCLLLG